MILKNSAFTNLLTMKTEIEKLKNEAWEKIAESAEERNSDELGRLHELIANLDSLQKNYDTLVQRFNEIKEEFTSPGKLKVSDPRGLSSGRNITITESVFCIRIDWGQNGRSIGSHEIFEKKASIALVKLMEHLHEVLGENVFKAGSRFKVSRGPLLSAFPDRDFVNSKNGGQYSSHRIPNSEYYVLTHSSTPQKVGDIERFLKMLGLAPGSYFVGKKKIEVPVV